MPGELAPSREQAEAFGYVSYTGSPVSPSMPTLEKLAEHGPHMAPLQGRADEPMLLFGQGLQAMKVAWGGPGPRDGVEYYDNNQKVTIYLNDEPEKPLAVNVMLDVRVVDELLISAFTALAPMPKKQRARYVQNIWSDIMREVRNSNGRA